jgi:hypothetical protein
MAVPRLVSVVAPSDPPRTAFRVVRAFLFSAFTISASSKSVFRIPRTERFHWRHHSQLSKARALGRESLKNKELIGCFVGGITRHAK